MARIRMPKPARTEIEARARSIRKLAALAAHVQDRCVEIAGYWDEGTVSNQLDQLLEAMRTGIASVQEAMDEEIACHAKEWV